MDQLLSLENHQCHPHIFNRLSISQQQGTVLFWPTEVFGINGDRTQFPDFFVSGPGLDYE